MSGRKAVAATYWYRQTLFKLQQLERLHSESPPPPPLITHRLPIVIHIRSQVKNRNKTKWKLQIKKKNAKNSNLEILQETLH